MSTRLFSTPCLNRRGADFEAGRGRTDIEMITAELLRPVPLLESVPDTELSVIAARAADIQLHANEWLIQEGELPAFFIVLSGRLNVYKAVGGTERLINSYGPGEYGGELPLMLGSPAIASLRAAEPSLSLIHI